MNNLYFSPDSLRSPLKERKNQSDTPVINRYGNPVRAALVAKNLKKMSDEETEYRVTSSLDDTREEQLLEEELLADSGPDDADIKAELESEQTEKPEVEADVKAEKQTVEEVDQLDLDEIDESSCHSWTEPVLSAVDEKPIPGSGRTTPDHEIQPPTKRGRGTDGSFRTAKNNTKRDFTHKNRKPKIVERETDEKTLQRRQKQIDYGKVTVDYEEYLNAIPKSERKHFHPRTPDKFQKMSRRGFDSQIKTWKINIHNWQNLGPKKE